MSNENDTELSHKDALNAYESLFGDVEPGADDAVAKEQDAKRETGLHERISEIAGEQAGADESGPAEDPTADDKTSWPEELKVVVSIKDGRATIGVQRPSSDPYIELFDDPDLSGLTQEVSAVIERARAKWEEAPHYPAYTRPASSTGRHSRRDQDSTQDSTAEEGVEQRQPQTPRLF